MDVTADGTGECSVRWRLHPGPEIAPVGATAADGRDVPSDNKVIGEQIDKKMDLATTRIDGTDLKRLTNGGGYTYASFSPDGSFVAIFDGYSAGLD